MPQDRYRIDVYWSDLGATDSPQAFIGGAYWKSPTLWAQSQEADVYLNVRSQARRVDPQLVGAVAARLVAEAGFSALALMRVDCAPRRKKAPKHIQESSELWKVGR